jgi:hypothetical protein
MLGERIWHVAVGDDSSQPARSGTLGVLAHLHRLSENAPALVLENFVLLRTHMARRLESHQRNWSRAALTGKKRRRASPAAMMTHGPYGRIPPRSRQKLASNDLRMSRGCRDRKS